MRTPNTVARERRSFRYARRTPPTVSQGSAAICWAAALECWLAATVGGEAERGEWSGEEAERRGFAGSPWKRERLSTEAIVERWKDLLNDDRSLRTENIPMIALEIGMTGSVLPAFRLSEPSVQNKLLEKHLYIVYFSMTMNHAVVGYGFDTREGILVMDPAPDRGLIARPFSFFQEPARANRMMFVGWAA